MTSFARVLFWPLLTLALAILAVESGAWTTEEIFAGPSAREAEPGSRILVLEVGKQWPLKCCIEVRGDDTGHPLRSDLEFWIDGRKMGPPHSAHTEIQKSGITGFSHWGRNVLFSLPNGTQNTSTLRVRATYSVRPAGSKTSALLLLASALLGLFAYRYTLLVLLKRVTAWLVTAYQIFKSRASDRLKRLMSQPIAVAFLTAAVLIAGAAFTVAAERAQTVVVQVEGSKPALDFLPSRIFGILGLPPQNFITTDPVGSAFLSWRYNRPVSLNLITHVTIGDVEGDETMRAMSLQYKNESGTWVEALRGKWREKDLNVAHSFALTEPHSHALSADWRVVALEGGISSRLIMGWLAAVATPPTGLWAVISNIKLDVLMLATLWLAAALLALSNRPKAGIILFFGGCFATIVVVNVVIFGLLRPPMLWTPDSSTYFLWPPHFERMPAAGLIYVSLFKVLGFFGLHIFQVNLVLVSYLGALGCIAFATKRYWPFIPLTALPILWGNFIVHSSSIMSEAWFISALLIALSGVIALIFGAGWRAAGWSGSGLLLGICFKPVAAALIPCIVLAYRFIPGSPARRRRMTALAVSPAILAYGVMSIYGYTAYSRFAPHAFGGFALAGHVAWMLNAEDLPEDYRAAGRQIVTELHTAYAALPPMTEADRFVNFTSNTYNTALWAIVVRHLVHRTAELQALPGLDRNTQNQNWRSEVALNDMLDAWARAAIVHDPLRYLAYCALHYWGLWRDSLSYYYTIGQSRWLVWEGYIRGDPALNRDYPQIYNDYNQGWRQKHESQLLRALQYPLTSIDTTPSAQYWAWFFLVSSLVLSALYILPARYSAPVAAMIIWSLFINAFIAGQALFQVTLTRYAEMIVPLFPFLPALALIWLSRIRATV